LVPFIEAWGYSTWGLHHDPWFFIIHPSHRYKDSLARLVLQKVFRPVLHIDPVYFCVLKIFLIKFKFKFFIFFYFKLIFFSIFRLF
jgi:uncharacterized membrane protein